MKQTRSRFITFNRIFGEKSIDEDGAKWLTISDIKIPDRDGYIWRMLADVVELQDGATVSRPARMIIRVKDTRDADKLSRHGWAIHDVDRALMDVYRSSLTDTDLSKDQRTAIADRLRASDYRPGLTTGGRGQEVTIRPGRGLENIKVNVQG